MDKQKTYLQVQLPAAIADEIKRQAMEELISSAAVVRRILAEHVRERLQREESR
jgi:hypothetical protein